MVTKPVDFYASKSKDLARFAYRNLASDLRAAEGDAARAAVLGGFLERLNANAGKQDFLKFKWVLPSFLKVVLREDECAEVERTLAVLRSRQSTKLFDVYPHCADEFSLDPTFIDATFDAAPVPLFGRGTPILTIGSCFARNIAMFLGEAGYTAETFGQAEDLNSPHSNAAMLAAVTAAPDVRADYLGKWLGILLTGYPADFAAEALKQETERLEKLRENVAAAKVLIVTLGNTIDYHFAPNTDLPVLNGIRVAPKFLAITATESVKIRTAFGRAAQQLGAVLRLATYAETMAAIGGMHAALRAINPDAPIVYTLSPVPIDSAIGLQGAARMGPIEVDCISKSTLRAAINDFFTSGLGGAGCYYFPSYELVRSVGAMLPAPNFGEQDASSRHVSAGILNAIYSFFLKKHGVA
jgi:hypothetical protein